MKKEDFLSMLLGRESVREEEEEAQTLDSLSDDEYPSSPLKVTDDDFERVIQRFPSVVVDCWAPWCGPCQMVAPVIAELAKDYIGINSSSFLYDGTFSFPKRKSLEGKIVFGKLNVDNARKHAQGER